MKFTSIVRCTMCTPRYHTGVTIYLLYRIEYKNKFSNIEEVSLHITVTKMAAKSRLYAVFIQLAVCDVPNLQFEFKIILGRVVYFGGVVYFGRVVYFGGGD